MLDVLRDRIEDATEGILGLNKRVVVFGTDDAAAATEQVEAFVSRALKARITAVHFVAFASAGAFGLRLSDGRNVFLKIHAGELPEEKLRAIHDAQELLQKQGLPIARRVLPLTTFSETCLASVHAFRDRGDKLRAGNRGAIEAAASGLVQLVQAGLRIPGSAEVPDFFYTARNPFYRRAPGVPEPPKLPDAERAEAVRRTAGENARLAAGRPVVGHSDWASRNLRFWKGGVSSIFDFEALRRGPEPLLVGDSAVRFINEPYGVADPVAATIRFIESYEKAAGYRFEGSDAAALDAGVALAVASHCYAAARSSEIRDDQASGVVTNFMTRFRERLQRDIPELPV